MTLIMGTTWIRNIDNKVQLYALNDICTQNVNKKYLMVLDLKTFSELKL